MDKRDEIYMKDIMTNVYNTNIKWDKMKDKTIFITGGTGLIGSLIINTVLYASKEYNLNTKVIALVRNQEKAKKQFKKLIDENMRLEFVVGDVCEKITNVEENIDYIIHAASETSSKAFVENPLGIIDIAINGTKNTLELAREKNVQNYIFLSTMEVYGRPNTDEKIDEKHGNDLITTEPRNCYPISKIMCENLCACYSKQYGFNYNIMRLTQTFGAGVKYNDGRVFAEFARCVIENRDIILHTKGDTKRNYLAVSDAVSAILLVLLSESTNEIYNVANEETYCSILEMAKLVANKNKNIEVKCVIDENIQKYGYAPTLCMNLDTNKLKSLGWKPKISLDEMYNSLIGFMENEENI